MNNNFLMDVENKLNYTFKNRDLLCQAFVRKSFSDSKQCIDHNEVLEFIGDRVIDLIVSKQLTSYFGEMRDPTRIRFLESVNEVNDFDYSCFFISNVSEGELTVFKSEIVRSESFASIIRELGWHEHLVMGKNDVTNQVQNMQHVQEDLLEAIVGAVALDCGYDLPTLELVVTNLIQPIQRLENSLREGNYVERSRELWQRLFKRPMEEYMVGPVDSIYWARIDIGMQFSFHEGVAPTEEMALLITAKRVCEELERIERIANSLPESLRRASFDRAINQLQELEQKGLIGHVEYRFDDEMGEADGEPVWWCEVYENDIDRNCACGVTKMEAKKLAAYGMLESILKERFNVQGGLKNEK